MTESFTAPVTTTPTAEVVEVLTCGVFTLDEEGHLTTDPAVREWMQAVAK